MKKTYPLLLLLVVLALLGRTAVTAFAPELNYSAVVSTDWAEESEEEDESEDDDLVFETVGPLVAVTLSFEVHTVPHFLSLETLPREIPKPPPQA